MNAFAVSLVNLVLAAEEKAPRDEDVVAGWMGFAVFAFLIVAVALIGWALTKSLKTAARAKEAGVYGDEPDTGDEPESDGAQPSR
jgi:hypothetical protein